MRKAVREIRAANKRRILEWLRQQPGSSARDVARAIGISPMSAGRTLQEMARLDRSVTVTGETDYERLHRKGRRTIPTYRVTATATPKYPPWLECVDISAWRRGLNGTR